MSELEARLEARRFVRIHGAAIVNVAFRQMLYPGVDGVLVRLEDPLLLPVLPISDRGGRPLTVQVAHPPAGGDYLPVR